MFFKAKAELRCIAQKIRNKFLNVELSEDEEDDGMDEILEKMSY